MEEDKCRECGRSWEDEIYWSHFQFIHFSQILPPDFYHHLAIPETFSKKLKKKLPEMVTLKGPSGSTWEVELTTNSSAVFFTHGWVEFATDHQLCQDDLLVFKYNGESQFDVLMFDGLSFCEKAAAYFVRRCGHMSCCSDCQAKRKVRESSVDNITASQKIVIQDTPAGETTRLDTDEIPTRVPNAKETAQKRVQQKSNFTSPSITKQRRIEPPPGFSDVDAFASSPEVTSQALPANDHIDEVPLGLPIKEDVADKMNWQNIDPKELSLTKQIKRNESPLGSSELVEVDSEPDAQHKPLTPKSVVQNLRCNPYEWPSEKERRKEFVLQMVKAAVTKEGFYVVMKPTNLSPVFTMEIPIEWIRKQLISPKKQDVVLCFDDKSWRISFLYNQCGSRSSWATRAFLGGGWRAFVVANELKEFDVCIFEPETPTSTPFRFNVDIIRCS